MPGQLLRSVFLVIAFGLPCWIVLRTLVGFGAIGRGDKISVVREVLLTTFFVYILVVAGLTIVPLPLAAGGEPHFNLVPLVNLVRGILPGHGAPPEAIKSNLENIAGNLLLLLPLGFFLCLFWDRFRHPGHLFVAALAVAMGIESIQFLFQYFGSFRVADIDDVMLNVVGAFFGLFLFRLFDPLLKGRVADLSGMATTR